MPLRVSSLSLLALTVMGPALAETPAFDRPGIAFSTTVLPAGTAALELGLPDAEYDDRDGVRSTLISGAANLRLGLGADLELQIAHAPYNESRTRAAGARETERGAGDVGLALKAALPSSRPEWSWAVLGAVGIDSGEAPFSAGDTTYDLGVTVAYELDDATAAAFYVNASRLDNDTTWTVSPSLSFALGEAWGGYIEAGFSHVRHGEDGSVAGGGLTWLLTPVVQLDLSVLSRVSGDSPDLSGGFGVSVFID